MNQLPSGVAMHRALVIRNKVVWPWLKLTEAQRKNVDDNTKGAHFNAIQFRRVLEQRRNS